MISRYKALENGGSLDHQYWVWDPAGISFEIIDDMTSDPVVTVVVSTPGGTLRFMAEPEMSGSTLILRGVHVQDAWANAVGAGNLKVLARTVMERMDLDGLVVEGALRTTGASPGRRPGVLRFSRYVRPAPAAEPGDPQDD
jgi:hypothetical protein